MNIRFEEIFNLSISKFKENWKKMVLNTIVYGLLTFVIVIAVIFVIIVSVLFTGFVLGIGNNVLAIIALIIELVVIFFGLLILSYLSATSGYVISKASFENVELIPTLKSVCTKSNIGFYIKRLFFPVVVLTVVVSVATLFSYVLSAVLGVLLTLVGFVAIFIYAIYLEAVFTLSLYKGIDIAANSKILIESFSKTEIFKTYFVQIGLLIILGIVGGVANIIPIIGLIFQLIFVSAGKVAITQAMIISLNDGEQNIEGITTNTQNKDVTINSESTTVVINSFGAQIKSVVCDQKEYMWQADAEYWGRTAPVLFPFVGKLKDDKYVAGDKTITMNQHGFLRDREFTVIAQTANSATFEYTSTLADYELYPCDFTVQITYQLIDRTVETKYNVINNSNYQIPYQIGAHPAFNVESVNDLTVVFPNQTVTQHYFEGGLQTTTEQVTIDELQLSYDLINKNIPCYSDFSTKQLVLKNKGEDFIKFDFSSMNYLAIWSPEYRNAKFICIEPWNGICSRKDQPDYQLENKDGMNMLPANSSQSCSFTFEIC